MNQHWIAKLEDVAELNPRAPKHLADHTDVAFVPMSAVSENGSLGEHGTRPYGEVKKGYTYFERGDLLIAKITPCFENGKAALVNNLAEPIGFGSTEFHVLRPGPELDGRYLFYMLWNDKFRASAAGGMTGSAGQKRVPADLLRRTEIRLPPLDEQRRIAAILDKADALRQKRKRAIALLDNLTQSIFLEMFGDPKQNPLGLREAELGEAADFFAGNSLPVGEDYRNRDDGYLLLKVSDMNLPGNEEVITYSAGWSASPGSKASTCPANAIVFPKRGGAISTNKKRRLSRPAILDPNVMGVYPKRGVLQDEYLFSWFQKLDLVEISSGSSVPQLNKQDLAPLKIAVPEMDRQREFAARVQSVRPGRLAAVNALTKVEDLFSSLQHRAFSGQI